MIQWGHRPLITKKVANIIFSDFHADWPKTGWKKVGSVKNAVGGRQKDKLPQLTFKSRRDNDGKLLRPWHFFLFQEAALRHGADVPDGAAGGLAGCGKVVITGNWFDARFFAINNVGK